MNSFQTEKSSLKDEATQLLNEGVEQYERGQSQQALETYQLEQNEKPLLHPLDISGQESNPPTVINPEPIGQGEKTLLHLRNISGQESNPPSVINPEPKKK